MTFLATDQLETLWKKIEEISSIPIISQTLTWENGQRVVGRPSASLETVGLKNGDMIVVTGEPVQKQSEDLVPIPSSGGFGGGRSVDTSINGNKESVKPTDLKEEDKSKTPLHQTFESYLRARRFDTSSLAGSQSYKSIFFDKGRLAKVPPSVTLTHQPYRHIDHLEFANVAEIQGFVNHWFIDLHGFTQRVGWMYGYYLEDTNFDEGYRAVVEGIYEPPQSDGQFLPDPLLATVDEVTSRLGLERVGWVFTGPARDGLVTAQESVRIAELQLKYISNEHYTGYPVSKLVTCIVSPDTQKGQPEIHALMVSDQAVGMVRDKLILVSDQSDKAVRVRQAEKNERLPLVLQTGKDVAAFDPDWFVVKVNHGIPLKLRSMFKRSVFRRENRVNSNSNSVRKYIDQVSRSEPSWERYSDFHLLLFIADKFDKHSAILLADCIKNKTDIGPDFEALIQAFASSR